METGVDRMMSVLEEKGKLSLTDLAKALEMPEGTLQLWVDFLVEERILGVEYKFTKPFVFLNKKQEKKAIVQELPEVDFFKKEFFEEAKKRQIPTNQILDLWQNHLDEAIEKQKEFFSVRQKKEDFTMLPRSITSIEIIC